MSGQSADRNLLFGIFALQMDFLTRDQLVEGMQAWVLEKSRPLEDILVEKGLLAAADRDLLLPLVARHVEQHGGSPEKSLKAISSMTPSVDVLKQIEDSDLQHSLASLKLGDPAHEGDGPATISYKPDFGQSGMRYLALRPHAKGGLGEVFVARDTELDREVALKEIQQHHAHDADSRSRFLMEAEITGKLEHPGIVPVYGLGHYPDGRPFYAMRFIRGDSLHNAIQDFHKNPPAGNPYDSVAFRKLLGRFIDVCNAVSYAHSRGVLHRDLKPGNIMLGKYGETLVVDWGLAKVKGREDSSSVGEATLQVSSGSGTDQTLPGSAIGTPGYMSPEQAEGQLNLLGPATDIYGLGATLYTLLTGKRPIEADTVHEVLRRTVKGTIPEPREHDPRIPRLLEAICLKAMALAPNARYATCQALADDVDRFLADEPVTAHREPLWARLARFGRKHKGVVRAVGGALILVTAIATGAALLVNEQRNRAEKLADEKSELAKKEETSRKLAQQNEGKEVLARKEAEQHARDAKKQLAWNYFTHGLAEYEAGRMRNGLLDLMRAWAVCPADDPLRKAYPDVLENYAMARGQAIGFPMRHERDVTSATFSPDGERVLTASWDYTARLWDGWTGAPLGEPMRHENVIYTATFSPDGERVLTWSADRTARLWDARTGDPLGEPMRHEHDINSVAFSRDGERVLTGSKNGIARLWDGRTGVPLGETMRHDGSIFSVAFSPDGERVVTGSADRTARLWNGRTGDSLGEPMRHRAAVEFVAFSPDGERVVTGKADSRLWDWKTGRPLGEIMQREGFVSDYVNPVVFSPDGERMLTGHSDKTARLWDRRTGVPLGKPMRQEGTVISLAFSPDGERVVTGSADRTARLWDARTGAPLGATMQHEGGVLRVAFSPDGERVVTGSEDRTARLWDGRSGAPVGEPMRHEGRINSVAFSPDGERVLTGSANGARLWDGRTGIPLVKPMPYQWTVNSVTFSPDGERVLTGSGNAFHLISEGEARLWDARTGEPLGEPMRHEDVVYSVAISSDGERVLTGSADSTARLWDARTGAPLGETMQHKRIVDSLASNSDFKRFGMVQNNVPDDAVISVAFNPDGDRVLTGSRNGTARLWDGRTGAPLGEPMRHEGVVYSVVFSPDSERVLTGSADSTARLWDARTGAALGEPMRHEGDVHCVAFSPDGERVVTGSADWTARMWDGRTGVPLGETMRHESYVTSAVFSPDGERVLTGSLDKTAHLWDGRTGTPLGETMRHKDSILSVAFSPDGDRVFTGKLNRVARLWSFTSTVFPQEEQNIKLCLEILTGTFLPSDSLAPALQLTSDEWSERWKNLEQKHQSFLEQIRQRSIRQTVEGHRHAAIKAECAGHWFAAEFHLRHLLQSRPDNQDLKSRHERAVRELERVKTAAKSLRNFAPAVEPAIAEKPE